MEERAPFAQSEYGSPDASVSRAHNNTTNNSRNNNGEVIEGVTAYFPQIIDATNVSEILSEKEEEEQINRRQCMFLSIGACVCMVIALAIIIPLVTLTGSSGSPEVVLETKPPTIPPTSAPSAAPTFEPISDELADMIQFIRQYENKTILAMEQWWDNRSSAAFQAAKWVFEEGNAPSLKALQRYALATFYYSTNWGTDWEECHPEYGACPGEPWLSPKDECNWGFVSCHSSGNVSDLIFTSQGNTLSGTLPPQLSLLSQMQVCAIPNNRLKGGNYPLNSSGDTDVIVKSGSNAMELHAIDLAFYGLSSLELVNFYDNEFSGTIPTRIWKTNPDLQKVMLNENWLKGTLPDELSEASSLVEIQFQGNYITGSIPSTLGLLHSSMKYIQFENNSLTGSIPTELFALTQLTSLVLTNNTKLTGDFHNDHHFTKLSNLQNFEASFTQLQGKIPDSIYESLTTLRIWDVESSSLSGILSEKLTLWNASLKTLWLQNNQFTGKLPTALDALTALEELRLEGNSFTGSISQTLCDRRGERFQELHVLTVDCSVNCTCCDFYEERCG